MEAFPALSWKNKISTLINKCPGFPGNSWQKELAQKKGSDPKNTNLQFTPPIATNMEVNLRILTLVNVEEKNIFFFATVKGGGVMWRNHLDETVVWILDWRPNKRIDVPQIVPSANFENYNNVHYVVHVN